VTDPARVPGKLGARPAVFPAGLRDLTYYVAGSLPAPPPSFAVPAITDWDLDGNSEYGDCGVAGLNHLLMAAAFAPGEAETFPTADQVVSYYLTYTGGQDSGVVLSDFLAYVRKTGFYGHTVSAYAPVQVADVSTLTTALWLYDAVYTGISVTQGMMDAFSAGQPWDLAAAQGQPIGGHCVPLVGFDSQFLYAVTWGQVQPIAYPAWHQVASEAWAVITGELDGGDGHGVNLAALQADLGKLDTPAPAPEHAGILSDLAALLRNAEADAGEILDAARAFLSRHHL
jgi:hypothetical protein